MTLTIFTLCSANYLAHAKTLGESVRRHHPEARFVIGLVDRVPSDLPPGFLHACEVLPVEQLKLPGFADMAARYNVVELNTAVKPFYLEHLYAAPEPPAVVIYLDPDIVLFSPMTRVLERLRTHHLIFTPHSCTPDDNPTVVDYEQAMLSTGVFNLGFLATSRSDETMRFLRWWQKRLFAYCYYRPGTGLFVDQIWTVLAPAYFESSFIERDPGHNTAYWNLFERRMTCDAGRWIVNDRHPLVFFHFSNYNPDKPEKLANRAWPAVPTFAERPELVPLYAAYRAALLRHGYPAVHGIKCQLGLPMGGKVPPPASAPKRFAGKVLATLPASLRGALGRTAGFVSRHCGAAS
ncbi:MAG: hypothetical protein Q8N18_15095 [Opitutaceae bacterium]|nr:hypothetical protein [Opitutaceae bacterium]